MNLTPNPALQRSANSRLPRLLPPAELWRLGRMGPRFRQLLSRDFAAAAVVAVVLVLVPMAAYSDYPSVFGESASLKLFILCGLGMSAAFSLLAGRGKRLIALMPGLVAGLAGAGLYLYVPQALLGVAPFREWGYAAFIVGALLGLLLYWLTRRLLGSLSAL